MNYGNHSTNNSQRLYRYIPLVKFHLENNPHANPGRGVADDGDDNIIWLIREDAEKERERALAFRGHDGSTEVTAIEIDVPD